MVRLPRYVCEVWRVAYALWLYIFLANERIAQVTSFSCRHQANAMSSLAATPQFRGSWTSILRTPRIGSSALQLDCGFGRYHCCVRFCMLTSTHSVGGEWVLGMMGYGQRWRDYRRAFWQHFHPGAIHDYRSVQLAAVRTFIVKLLHDPENLRRHISL